MMVIFMIKKLYEEYMEAKKEKKSSYYKIGLISLILSLVTIILWIGLTILVKLIEGGLFQGVLLILYFVQSFIINPFFLLLSIFLLVLQWQVSFNKITLFTLIGNILLLTSIIISFFII